MPEIKIEVEVEGKSFPFPQRAPELFTEDNLKSFFFLSRGYPYLLWMISQSGDVRARTNAAVLKDALLSELATEIENLKRELIATRHRNGIYMTPDAHEELVKKKESRRIINKEQKERIEVLESVVQHKAEELLALTRQLQNFESDNKEAHSEINRMNDALNKAHDAWQGSVTEVSDVTEKVETRMKNFQAHQNRLLQDFSANVSHFFENEMTVVQKNRSLLHDALLTVENIEVKFRMQPLKGETEEAFHELKQISNRVGAMFDLTYNTLDKDVQSTFKSILKNVEEQNVETNKLRFQLQGANSRLIDMNHKTSLDVARLLEEERTGAEAERQKFLSQISALYDLSLQQRWDRLQGSYGIICSDISRSGSLIEEIARDSRIDECIARQKQFDVELVGLRGQLETVHEQHLSVQQAVVSANQDLQRTMDDHEKVVESAGKFQNDMSLHSDTLKQPIATLENDICQPLSHVRASIRGCSLLTTASLRQPDYTTTFPRHDALHYHVSSHGKGASTTHSPEAPLTSLVNKRPREQDFSDRPEATRSEQERTPYGISENLAEPPCLEVTSEARLKRRRL
ncbi:kinesin-domain-containing protein [Penicillium mononematosum]|uniref:kinesin-domain-containing protein n=1 Tax=Penicillium mononematosum TaxID=268346 RepID=UPI00254886A9|nr:kinesin-domain-containing protein [Penicillium mononematosum]KAJ6189642.1 kinesin-domain-containing protein [Penicillium mononematosum]